MGKRSLEGDQIQELSDWDRDGEEKLRGTPEEKLRSNRANNALLRANNALLQPWEIHLL
jgi:hypothetical protein